DVQSDDDVPLAPIKRSKKHHIKITARNRLYCLVDSEDDEDETENQNPRPFDDEVVDEDEGEDEVAEEDEVDDEDDVPLAPIKRSKKHHIKITSRNSLYRLVDSEDDEDETENQNPWPFDDEVAEEDEVDDEDEWP
ncbi:hypothetical protein Tco_0293523, partial [Tanacetum coccineum]